VPVFLKSSWPLIIFQSTALKSDFMLPYLLVMRGGHGFGNQLRTKVCAM
jgi:hypothetical protein